ncbi:MAG: ABC transporter ATP-binding protein, partial [Chloroflexi bacterium]|nr:ABC transporter ATP-binding protein [Chloroflexota bacterium]
MDNDLAIRMRDLGKMYHLGRAPQHNTLRDTVASAVQWPLRGLRRSGNQAPRREEDPVVWALREICFDVARGDAIGIIGRNGAGKSTLLKTLSRITEPTEGYAEVQGRVGSLLEVGTGFHPELTGRENIYLNGAILGMRRAEIARKFDEIVAFAEIEEFLDTPVKRYSSGMYVRLAFAVAAHLEPEILIVDEVLAVGDLAFQKKCLGKMGDVTRGGRTVLFVSHNMNAIQRLCRQCLLIDQGRLVAHGDTPEIVNRYVSASSSAVAPGRWIDLTRMSRTGTGRARFTKVWYSSDDASADNLPYSGGPLEIVLEIDSDAPRTVGSVAATLYDEYGSKLVNADTISLGRRVTLAEGRNTIHLRIRELHLNPGIYVLGLWVADPPAEIYDFTES